jgi:hypothetical protein
MSGQNISTTGMVILVSIAPLVDGRTPVMEQYSLVLPFLMY